MILKSSPHPNYPIFTFIMRGPITSDSYVVISFLSNLPTIMKRWSANEKFKCIGVEASVTRYNSTLTLIPLNVKFLIFIHHKAMVKLQLLAKEIQV
jgi:hypothetical protein